MLRPTRRELFAAFGSSLAGLAVQRLFGQAYPAPHPSIQGAESRVSGDHIFGAWSAAKAAPPVLFDTVSPARSGITWTHANGRSPDYYLPEATGAGCAFLDYDNDGWMDIYHLPKASFEGIVRAASSRSLIEPQCCLELRIGFKLHTSRETC